MAVAGMTLANRVRVSQLQIAGAVMRWRRKAYSMQTPGVNASGGAARGQSTDEDVEFQ